MSPLRSELSSQSTWLLTPVLPSVKGQQLATAVCSRIAVPAGGRRVLEMALVWDMPRVFFSGRRREYRR